MTLLVSLYLIIGVLTSAWLYLTIPEATRDANGEASGGFERFTILLVVASTWPFWWVLITVDRWRA